MPPALPGEDVTVLFRDRVLVRAVVQRVSSAEVRVEDRVVASMTAGLLVLVGVGIRDEVRDAR